jgi:hypothetical protein
MALHDERIREVSPLWRWGGRGPITDPIDMDFRLGDLVERELTVVRLETAAQIYRALTEGFSRAAQAVQKQTQGGG